MANKKLAFAEIHYRQSKGNDLVNYQSDRHMSEKTIELWQICTGWIRNKALYCSLKLDVLSKDKFLLLDEIRQLIFDMNPIDHFTSSIVLR